MKTNTLRSLRQFAVAVLVSLALLSAPLENGPLLSAPLLSAPLFSAPLLSGPRPARAALVIEVTTTSDSPLPGQCSLRQAIQAANTNAAVGGCIAGSATGTDFIHLPSGVYSPSTPANPAPTEWLLITSSIAIYGDGADTTTIDAKSFFRAFTVNIPNSKVAVTAMFNNITITGGKAANPLPNTANGYGGAILVFGPSTVSVNAAKITGNTAALNGGGVASTTNSVVNVDQSEIFGNTAASGSGFAVDGTLIINRSSIYNNTATTNAAINSNGSTQITNTTISANSAASGQAAGVLVSGTSNVILLNDTIVDNKGIGLEVLSPGTGSIKNTILARQSSGTTDYANCNLHAPNTFVSLGHNLVSNDNLTDTCKFSATGDKPVAKANLGLGAFGNADGGLTRYYPLTPYVSDLLNPAVDAGDNIGCPAVDQRMYSRPERGKSPILPANCDIGSYELMGLPLSERYYLPSISR